MQSLPQSETGGFIAGRAKAIEALTGTVQQINRRLLHTLQPAALSERGLAAALRDLADGWQEAHPAIDWSLDMVESDLARLSDEAALAVYRMVQEGMTNIARHSGCSEAQITISSRSAALGERLDILVSDDGRGFDSAPRQVAAFRAWRNASASWAATSLCGREWLGRCRQGLDFPHRLRDS